MTLEVERSEKKPRNKRGGNAAVDQASSTFESPADPAAAAEQRSSPSDDAPSTRGGAEEIKAGMQPAADAPQTFPVVQQETVAGPQLPEPREVGRPSPVLVKKLGSVLAKKMPGAEHIVVKKRLDNGQLGYVGSYGLGDLDNSQSLETFLDRYVKPKFGPGDYQVFGNTPDGKTYDGGVITLLPPLDEDGARNGRQAKGEFGAFDAIQRALERQAAERRDENERLIQALGKRDDGIETLRKAHELQKEIGGDEMGTGIASALTAIGQQQHHTTELIVTMINKSEERMSTLLTTILTRDRGDSVTPLLLELLKDRMRPSEPMPPPPPVAAPDPTTQLKNLVEAVALLQPKQDTTMLELMKHTLDKAENDRVTTKDVIELLKDKQEQPGSDAFRKGFEDFGLVMDVVKRVRDTTDPGPPSGWEVASQLLANREITSTIVGAIRGRPKVIQQPTQQMPEPFRAALPSDIEARRAHIMRRRLALEERKLQMEERQLGIVTPPPEPKAPVQPSPEEQKEAMDRVLATTGKLPPLPPEISEYVNGLIRATDDASLVGATIDLLQYLSTQEHYQQIGETTLGLLHTADRRALDAVRAFSTGLAKAGLITAELAERIVIAIDQHFDTVVAEVQKAFAEGEPEGEGEAPQEPAP